MAEARDARATAARQVDRVRASERRRPDGRAPRNGSNDGSRGDGGGGGDDGGDGGDDDGGGHGRVIYANACAHKTNLGLSLV